MDEGSSKKKEGWKLTKESFARLLGLFDPDEEKAAEKYEQLRKKLIEFFTHRRGLPDYLVDETFNRIAKKADEGELILNVTAYARKVAGYVAREHSRSPEANPTPLDDQTVAEHVQPPTILEEMENAEADHLWLICTKKCWKTRSPADKDLVLHYYRSEENKSERRKELAEERGISKNALAIRVNRICQELKECVQECMKQAHRRLK